MAVYQGSKKEIALSKESTRGTPVAASAGDWRPHTGFAFAPIVEKAERSPAMGHIATPQEQEVVKEYGGGSIPMQLSAEFAGDLANLIMGVAPSTTGPSGDYYTHTWAALANNNEHLAYTVSVVDPIKGDVRYPRGMLNSCRIDAVPEDYVVVELDMLAGKEASTSLTPSYSTTDEFYKPQQVEIKFADTYAGLGAASETLVSSLNMTIEKNAVIIPADGQTNPKDIANQDFRVTGDIELPYETSTFRDLGLGDGTKAMQVTITHGTYSIQFQFPLCSFMNWNDGEDVAAYMPETFSFMGHRDATNGIIQMVVVDKASSH